MANGQKSWNPVYVAMLSQVEEKKWLVASKVEPHEVWACMQGSEVRRLRRRAKRRMGRNRSSGSGGTDVDTATGADNGGLLLIVLVWLYVCT